MPATVIDPRTALVVIDLQRGLASFPTVHPFAGVVANTARLADAFRAAKLPVVLVTVGFAPDAPERIRVRTDAPQRAFDMGPEFSEIVPELGPKPGDVLIVKRQPNAFFGTELDLQLRRRKITGIVLTGVSTSVGVDATARAANEQGYELTFASDAMTDMDAQMHEVISTKMFPRLGEVDTTDKILALLPR